MFGVLKGPGTNPPVGTEGRTAYYGPGIERRGVGEEWGP
jgi:hypothetical protein